MRFSLHAPEHRRILERRHAARRPERVRLTVKDVDREIRVIEKGMVLLPDSEAVYHEWRRLVVAHSVSGVKVHDARLAASMRVHGVTHLLTLNVDDFKQYTHITAVHPGSMALSG